LQEVDTSIVIATYTSGRCIDWFYVFFIKIIMLTKFIKSVNFFPFWLASRNLVLVVERIEWFRLREEIINNLNYIFKQIGMEIEGLNERRVCGIAT